MGQNIGRLAEYQNEAMNSTLSILCLKMLAVLSGLGMMAFGYVVERSAAGSCKLRKENIFEYQNPITSDIEGGMRDCQVIEDEGRYFLVGTSYPFWYWQPAKNPGVKIYSSDNLLKWKFEKLLIDRSKLDSTVWYLDRFWAPEIHKIQGKYYLLFNCQNETTKDHIWKGQHGGVAVSNNILCEYEVLTHEAPFVRGNDLTFFEDRSSGKVYAFFNRDKAIYGVEVDLKDVSPMDEPALCFKAGNLQDGDWDGIGVEGAYCIKKGGRYYLFYSSWSRGYEIGYATSDHPLGPWVKFQGNPVYGAQMEVACIKNNLDFTGDPESPWAAVGHNEVFEGPDGRLWISCHGILKEERVPYLVIDPIDFENGVIKIDGPTHTKQQIRY